MKCKYVEHEIDNILKNKKNKIISVDRNKIKKVKETLSKKNLLINDLILENSELISLTNFLKYNIALMEEEIDFLKGNPKTEHHLESENNFKDETF